MSGAATTRWKTAEEPKRSASVTWPVALTKAANRALVTAVSSMWKGFRRTVWTGVSPSAG